MIVEAIGMVATLIVLLSFTQKGEFKIRLINLFGAVGFVIYGLLNGALSVWVLNGALIIIQIYNITKRSKQTLITEDL